jgi:flagellar hook-basal body complex protein FliE
VQDREIIDQMLRRQKAFEYSVTKTLKGYHRDLHDVLSVMTNADETLCNVLLAIRQNEYLQAWYPPQRGNPEQKVVGKYV